MGDEAPWREITPDDYLRETMALTRNAQNALLSAQHQGRFRLRLVLRESLDLKHGTKRDWNPLWVHDYHFGRHNLIHAADEVVIERCDGSRYRVNRSSSPWTTELIEEGRSLAT